MNQGAHRAESLMTSTPPTALHRRIRLCRRFAATLCFVWPLAAYAVFWLFKHGPKSVAFLQGLYGCTVLLGLGVVWFVYLIYHIGELAQEAQDSPDSPF